jgi:hypothetical protein
MVVRAFKDGLNCPHMGVVGKRCFYFTGKGPWAYEMGRWAPPMVRLVYGKGLRAYERAR